jgi:hypothetical protein
LKIQKQIENLRRNDNILSLLYKKCFFHEFSVAPVEKAIGFSFEKLPQKLYNLNHNNLPFGCHAWFKYDFDFWEPFIIKFGYEFSKNPQKPFLFKNDHNLKN